MAIFLIGLRFGINLILPYIHNLSCLKGLLTPEATECITGLALTNDNYIEAVTLLKERYGNKQVLINAIMDSFVKLPTIHSKNHVKELRALYDQVEITIRNLKSLDVEINTYGSSNWKVTKWVKDGNVRFFKGEVWGLDGVVEIFKNELQELEHYGVMNPTGRRTNEFDNFDAFTTSNLHGHQERMKQLYRPPRCIFCNGTHSPSQCNNVTYIRSRVSLLCKKGRCFLCLSSGHLAAECKSDYTCRKCNKRHNISMW